MLNFHFRGPKKQRVPLWMRKFIIGYLGRAFCFCYESQAYMDVQEESKVPNVQILNKNKKKQTKKNNTIENDQNHKFYQNNSSQKLNYNYKKQTKFKSDSNESDMSDFENQIEPAYVKVSKFERNCLKKENHIVLEYSNETDVFVTR